MWIREASMGHRQADATSHKCLYDLSRRESAAEQRAAMWRKYKNRHWKLVQYLTDRAMTQDKANRLTRLMKMNYQLAIREAERMASHVD